MRATGITRHGGVRHWVVIGLAAIAVTGTALVTGTGPRALAVNAASSSSTPAGPGFAVSQAIDPTSGNIYLAAQGPGHSLYFYWDLSGTWYGPLAVGGSGTTFSAPSLTVDSSHNVVIAAQGPGNSLYFYWNVKGTWHGPLQVGATGAAVSTPTLVSDLDGNVDLAVQSPGQSLSFYWNTAAKWYGPYGLGAAGMSVSTPSAAAGSDSSGHHVFVSVQGPNNSLIAYTSTSGTWTTAQSSPQTTFSAPSAQTAGSQTRFYVQGAGHDLDNWIWSSGPPNRVYGYYPIGPGDVTLSAPSGLGSDGYGGGVTAIGPSNSLYFYWFTGTGWEGPLGVGAAGSAFSIPSIAAKSPASGANPSIAVQGPNNSLYFYWNLSGTWYGPLGVGPAGSTFSSAH